jgi:uncharacterized protein YbjT (DUF2867 family)
MKIRNVCLLGATGFVGRALAARLYDEGIEARVITRQRMRASRLLVLPTLDLRVADPHDEEALTRHFAGMDAVVNLVGILHEGGGATFQSAHVDLPRKVANACRAAGVPRLVHMSALGASESAPSEYLRSKARGEASLRQGAGDALGITIFRPSVIYGAHDGFLNLFARLVAAFPVIPLAAADARFQPIWVEDVARAMAHALRHPAPGRTYELGGPRAYTLAELVAFVARVTGKRRAIVALPSWAGRLQATAFEFLPGKLITRDNLLSMSVPNTCSGPFPEVFGFQPAALETVVPGYLAGASVKGRYDAYRNRAGR